MLFLVVWHRRGAACKMFLIYFRFHYHNLLKQIHIINNNK